jgi:hypothetical protein
MAVVALTAAGVISIVGCLGQRSYFAGRPVPPSTILQRVLVSVQNPGSGVLQILDGRYDIRNSQNGKIPNFTIKSYSGGDPTTIFNYPEQSAGYVYNSAGTAPGTVTPVNYSTESATGVISSLPGISSSIFVTQDGNYIFAANQPAQYVTVIDHVKSVQVSLNLPNVYKVASNPSGTVVLAFVQNSNYAYRIIRLQQPNGTVMAPPVFTPTIPWPSGVSPVDCQPVNLPTYCVVPVVDQNQNAITFDRPYNTIFSPDGTTAWLMNCGAECGGTASSVSFLSAGVLNIYNFPGTTYPTPPPTPAPPTEQQRVAVPGGATMAVYGTSPTTGGGLLYVSGQQLQTSGQAAGFFGGNLSIINLANNQITGTYQISDGLHTKMLLGDDNTLWIGSQNCQTGVRTALHLVDASGNPSNGCLTMIDTTFTNKNAPIIEPPNGDLTGLCAVIEWHKMYTAEGGQVYIYATTSYNGSTSGPTGSNSGFTPGTVAGSPLSNYFVTVQGTAYDVAYMDAPSNAAD